MINKDFLNMLDKLIILSDEPCTCDHQGDCKSCRAQYEIENLYTKVDNILTSLEGME
jgi:hypothetical protein